MGGLGEKKRGGVFKEWGWGGGVDTPITRCARVAHSVYFGLLSKPQNNVWMIIFVSGSFIDFDAQFKATIQFFKLQLVKVCLASNLFNVLGSFFRLFRIC